MRFVEFSAPTELERERISQITELYGKFDIGFDGLPTEPWVNRNLRFWRPPEPMQHASFPDIWIRKMRVNRRMHAPLYRVYNEIVVRFESEARRASGLNQFVRCYCFGDGGTPNLFWYGGAWELSPAVNGAVLDQVIDIFKRHGFSHTPAGARKVRTFEYW